GAGVGALGDDVPLERGLGRRVVGDDLLVVLPHDRGVIDDDVGGPAHDADAGVGDVGAVVGAAGPDAQVADHHVVDAAHQGDAVLRALELDATGRGLAGDGEEAAALAVDLDVGGHGDRAADPEHHDALAHRGHGGAEAAGALVVEVGHLDDLAAAPTGRVGA